MRVLHATRFYHPHVGGTETFIAGLAAATAPFGIESAVIATDRRATSPGPPPMAPTTRVRAVGPDYFPVPVALADLVRAWRSADIVHLHDLRFLVEWSALMRLVGHTPIVLSSHGLIFHTEAAAWQKRLLWSTYYRALLRAVDVLACDSSQDYERCSSIGLRRARLMVNPVDIEAFHRVPDAKRRKGTLLYFGRLAPNKGLDRLVAVMHAAPSDWTLTIAGTGESRYARDIAMQFEGFGTRVSIVGAVSGDHLGDLGASHACVVLPSRAEGFGLTLVEALAMGVPIVASDIETYREIAADSPAQLVSFDEPEAVVGACRNVMRDWDAVCARQRAESFSWPAHAPTWVALYQELVNR